MVASSFPASVQPGSSPGAVLGIDALPTARRTLGSGATGGSGTFTTTGVTWTNDIVGDWLIAMWRDPI